MIGQGISYLNLRQSYLVPYLSMPFTSFSSSSGAQPPLTTSEAILANHRLRQSLFVLFGTCFEIACHLLGFELSGSSEKEHEICGEEVRRPKAHLFARRHGGVGLLLLSRNGALCRTWLRMGGDA